MYVMCVIYICMHARLREKTGSSRQKKTYARARAHTHTHTHTKRTPSYNFMLHYNLKSTWVVYKCINQLAVKVYIYILLTCDSRICINAYIHARMQTHFECWLRDNLLYYTSKNKCAISDDLCWPKNGKRLDTSMIREIFSIFLVYYSTWSSLCTYVCIAACD